MSNSPSISNFASNSSLKTPIFEALSSYQKKQLKQADLVKRVMSVVDLDQQNAEKELKSLSESDYKILKAVLCTKDNQIKSEDNTLFNALFSYLDIFRDNVVREMLEEEENLKTRNVILSHVSADLSATEKTHDAEKERLEAEQKLLKKKNQEVEDNEKRKKELKERVRVAAEKQRKLLEDITQSRRIRKEELQARERQANEELDRLRQTNAQLKSGCVIT